MMTHFEIGQCVVCKVYPDEAQSSILLYPGFVAGIITHIQITPDRIMYQIAESYDWFPAKYVRAWRGGSAPYDELVGLFVEERVND